MILMTFILDILYISLSTTEYIYKVNMQFKFSPENTLAKPGQ